MDLVSGGLDFSPNFMAANYLTFLLFYFNCKVGGKVSALSSLIMNVKEAFKLKYLANDRIYINAFIFDALWNCCGIVGPSHF